MKSTSADNLMTKVWNLEFSGFRSPGTAFVVTLAIAKYSMRRGYCWATQGEIASAVFVSPKTVQRVVSELEAMDPPWLKRQQTQRAGGMRGRDELFLTLPEVVLSADVVAYNDTRTSTVMNARNMVPVSTGTDEASSLIRTLSPELRTDCPDTSITNITKQDPLTPKGGIAGISDSEVTKAVEALWNRASSEGRQRSGARGKVQKALEATLRRGHSMEKIMRGMGAYFASREASKNDGEFQKAIQRVLENDVWETYLVEDPRAMPVGGGSVTSKPLADGATPGPQNEPRMVTGLQRALLEQFKIGITWDRQRYGPAPDMPGCKLDHPLLVEYGHRKPPAAPVPAPPAPPASIYDDEDNAGAFD